MSNVRSLQDLIRVTLRINTSASCHSSRVLPRAPFQPVPPEVTAAQSVEVLSVNTSGLLVGFAQQGPVHVALAHMAGSSSSQFMKGASRRRAAPGSRPVAARAATCPASNEVAFARERPGGSAPCEVRFPFIRPSTRGTPQSQAPKACGSPRGPAQAQRLRPWRATAGVGGIRPRLPRFGYALACEQTPPTASFHQESAVCERELMSLGTKRPNPLHEPIG